MWLSGRILEISWRDKVTIVLKLKIKKREINTNEYYNYINEMKNNISERMNEYEKI